MSPGSLPDIGLYIIGLGLNEGHLTREASRALRLSQCRFYLHSNPEIARYIERLPGRAVDLSGFYTDYESRVVTYRRVASVVVEAAVNSPPVCLALYGHPLILSTLSTMVLAAAQWLDLTVAVVPGISSLDTVIADLQIDPGTVALQIQEATDLVLYKRTLDATRGALLLQVAHFGSHIYVRSSITPARLRPLVSYLSTFYPFTHPVFLVRSSSERYRPPVIERVSLEELAAAASRVREDTTMYIPPLSDPAEADVDFQRSLTSLEYLQNMVKDD